MLMLPAAIAGLIGLHLYLVIRLGVTSPPWSKDAAGKGPLPEPSHNGSGPNGATSSAAAKEGAAHG